MDRQFVDLDPVFNHNLDDDYDFRAAGVTRASFWNVYGEWIQFCCEKKRQQMQTALNEKNTPKKNPVGTSGGATTTVAAATTVTNSAANDTNAKGADEETTKDQSEQQSNSSRPNLPDRGESSTNGAATSSSGNNGNSIAGTSSQPFFSSVSCKLIFLKIYLISIISIFNSSDFRVENLWLHHFVWRWPCWLDEPWPLPVTVHPVGWSFFSMDFMHCSRVIFA